MDKLKYEALLQDMAHLQADPEYRWTLARIEAACKQKQIDAPYEFENPEFVSLEFENLDQV